MRFANELDDGPTGRRVTALSIDEIHAADRMELSNLQLTCSTSSAKASSDLFLSECVPQSPTCSMKVSHVLARSRPLM
jgi:hypothetical protein